MKRFTVVLLLTALAVAADDFSGSGYTDDSDTSCKQPLTVEVPMTKEAAAVKEIRCHHACIDKVMEQRNISIEMSHKYAVWPTITEEALETDCRVYQQVEECRRGCVKMTGGNRRTCTSSCFQDCQRSCRGENECSSDAGSSCSRLCDNNFCSHGCNIVLSTAGNRPTKPRSEPLLSIPEQDLGAGRYLVYPGNTSLGVGDLNTTLHHTSFLFRVLHRQKMLFYWLRTLDDVLNLEVFSCRVEVFVQYYAVNKYGISIISPSHEIVPTVYGDLTRPENPSIILSRPLPDTRFGFWKHAVIKVTWDKPRGFQLLNHYIARLIPQRGSLLCGTAQEFYVPKNETSVLLSAVNPTDGPVNACSYGVSVTSISKNGRETGGTQTNLINIQVNNSIPTDFTCNQEWNQDNGTFQFSVSWMIPNSSHLVNSISTFVLRVRLVKPGLDVKVNEDKTDILFDMEELRYNHSLQPVPYGLDPEAYYSIQLETRPNISSNLILMPAIRHCEYSTLPLPLQVINEIYLDEDRIHYLKHNPVTGELEFEVTVSWSRPEGRVRGYEVRLVEFPPSESNSVGEVFEDRYIEGDNQTTITFRATVPSDIPIHSCIHIQVRSISIFMAYSNWSEAKCVMTVRPTANYSPTTTASVSPGTVVFIMIGLGGGMILATSVTLMIMGLVYFSLKRSKVYSLESQRDFHKHLPSGANTSTSSSYPFSKILSQGGGDHTVVMSLDKFSTEEWELHPSQVLVETRLGHGSFGDVFKGMIRGGVGLYKFKGPPCLNSVAIKLLQTMATAKEKEQFLCQVEQAKLVSSQKPGHQNIVAMIGCVTTHEPLCMVMELPANGDLLSYLLFHRRNIFAAQNATELSRIIKPKESNFRLIEPDIVVMNGTTVDLQPPLTVKGVSDESKLTGKELLIYASQIASGLEYISSLGLIHGDVACRNMFLDRRKQIKITHFDLNLDDGNRGGSRVYINTETGRLPIKWLAPESLPEGRTTAMTDVWAFGVTLWEIVTLGGLPYNAVRNKDMLGHLREGHRLQKPNNCSQELYDVMLQCWKGIPLDRPSFKVLYETLNKMNRENTTPAISMDINSESTYYKILRSPRGRSSASNRSNEIKCEVDVTTYLGEMEAKSRITEAMTLNQQEGKLPKIDEDEEVIEDMSPLATCTPENHDMSQIPLHNETSPLATCTPENHDMSHIPLHNETTDFSLTKCSLIESWDHSNTTILEDHSNTTVLEDYSTNTFKKSKDHNTNTLGESLNHSGTSTVVIAVEIHSSEEEPMDEGIVSNNVSTERLNSCSLSVRDPTDEGTFSLQSPGEEIDEGVASHTASTDRLAFRLSKDPTDEVPPDKAVFSSKCSEEQAVTLYSTSADKLTIRIRDDPDEEVTTKASIFASGEQIDEGIASNTASTDGLETLKDLRDDKISIEKTKTLSLDLQSLKKVRKETGSNMESITSAYWKFTQVTTPDEGIAVGSDWADKTTPETENCF